MTELGGKNVCQTLQIRNTVEKFRSCGIQGGDYDTCNLFPGFAKRLQCKTCDSNLCNG